jgi:hypothetical protein
MGDEKKVTETSETQKTTEAPPAAKKTTAKTSETSVETNMGVPTQRAD